MEKTKDGYLLTEKEWEDLQAILTYIEQQAHHKEQKGKPIHETEIPIYMKILDGAVKHFKRQVGLD